METGPRKELLEVALAPDGYSHARRLLACTEGPRALGMLERRIVGVVELARRLDAANEEIRRFAELRLETLRKLGEVLMATQLRGGAGGTRSLPEGVSRRVSSQAQRLAQIPEVEFQAALKSSRSRRALPSVRWMLKSHYDDGTEDGNRAQLEGRAQRIEAALPSSELWSWVGGYMPLAARFGDFPEPLSRLPAARPETVAKSGSKSLIATFRPQLARLLSRLSQGEFPSFELLVAIPPGAVARWLTAESPTRWVLTLLAGWDEHCIVYWGPRWHGFMVGARSLGLFTVSGRGVNA